jgi:hypothetical protein
MAAMGAEPPRPVMAGSGMTAFEMETVESSRSPASFRPIYSAPSRAVTCSITLNRPSIKSTSG